MVNVMRGMCLTFRSRKGPRSTSQINRTTSVCTGVLMAVALSACAGDGPFTGQSDATAPVAAPPAVQAAAGGTLAARQPAPKRAAGPMKIQASRPEAPKTKTASAALVPVGDRLEFVDWFGAAAEPARAPNPVDQLRKARAVTAKIDQPATDKDGRRLFTDDENGRLLPATMALPKPQEERTGRRSDVLSKPVVKVKHTKPAEAETPRLTTGSLRPSAEKADDAKGKQGAVVQQLREIGKKLKSAGSGKASSPTIIASASKNGPTRQSPLRIQIAKGRPGFNGHERGVLDQLAQHQRDTGRKVHILSIARGPAGGKRETKTRVRRLLGHAERATVYLAQQGVPRSRIDVMTSEQRMTGIDFGPNGAEDVDRLEFYLE